jgi:hypothetical protein
MTGEPDLYTTPSTRISSDCALEDTLKQVMNEFGIVATKRRSRIRRFRI